MDALLAKTILTKAKSPQQWFGADYGCNLYRGCSHGCIYCDSRSECYHNDNFSSVMPKKDALAILNKEMASKRSKGIIGTGAMSDPYNPLEKKLELTRGLLSLANHYHFGITIYTKATLVLRDIDLLQQISQHSAAVVCMTITTFDDTLSKIIEPYAPKTSLRFDALRKLKDAGIVAGIILMPLLPWINDTPHNLSQIISTSAKFHLDFIYPMFGVTLRDRQRAYFYERLDHHFPELKQKYQQRFKDNYICNSPNIKELSTLFKTQCKHHKIPTSMNAIISLYKTKKVDYEMLSFDL
ncbi:MAG: radical SAM protein [Anaerorhabdus sp.]